MSEHHEPPDSGTSDDLRDAMVDMIMHDIRSPLSVASGMVESVLQHWDTFDVARRRDLLGRASRAHRQIGELLDRLADVEHAQVIVLEPRPVRVRDVMRDVVAKSILEPSRLTVRVTPPDLTVMADAFALERVLANLLDNVAHHAPARTPSAVYTRVEDGWGVVEVRSNKGVGLDGSPDSATTLRPGVRLAGHGIGLVLAARFAASMGGDLEIQEHTGGVVVSVRLPLAPASDRKVTGS